MSFQSGRGVPGCEECLMQRQAIAIVYVRLVLKPEIFHSGSRENLGTRDVPGLSGTSGYRIDEQGCSNISQNLLQKWKYYRNSD